MTLAEPLPCYFRARFRREVALLAWVQGLCRVRVIGADAESATPFLATEYAPGPSLAEFVAQYGPLSTDMLYGLATGLAGDDWAAACSRALATAWAASAASWRARAASSCPPRRRPARPPEPRQRRRATRARTQATGVGLPDRRAGRARPPDLRGTRMHALMMTGFQTGMRPGELRALQ